MCKVCGPGSYGWRWELHVVISVLHKRVFYPLFHFQVLLTRRGWVYLGALASLRKATFSLLIPAKPPACMEQHGSNWTDIHEIWYPRVFFFSKICREDSSFIKIWREWTVLYMKSYLCRGRDSSVGIATRYGLDGPGIESRCGGWDFPHAFSPSLGPTQPPVQWVPGVKRPVRGADHPPPSKRRGHEKVELYLYSPSGPSWPVIGWTFTFTFTFTNLCACMVSYRILRMTNFTEL